MTKWISVEKKLPKDDETVLGANSKMKDYLPVFCYYDEEVQNFFFVDNCSYPIVITHWTEVPRVDQEG